VQGETRDESKGSDVPSNLILVWSYIRCLLLHPQDLLAKVTLD